MSETSVKGPYPYAKIALGGTAFLLLVAVLPSVFLPIIWHPEHQVTRVTCEANLKQLGLVSIMYAEAHRGQFPTAERWCDLLAAEFEKESFKEIFEFENAHLDETFHCPRAESGPCSYAMNPHADPNSAEDVVLLFESNPGWNQYGAPELLATANHDGQGCNVLFVDGHVNFVRADAVNRLNWGDGGMPSFEARDGQQENEEE